MAHQIAEIEPEDEQEYDENADEDFNPEQNAAEEGDGSSSSDQDDVEAATMKAAPKKGRKRKSDAVATAELDSGDEATIQERKSKRRKKAVDEGEDSGGEGGLIKTRAQRMAEKVEKKQRKYTTQGLVTIDVERLWAELSAVPVGRVHEPVALPAKDNLVDGEAMALDEEQSKENKAAPAQPPDKDDMITIKRTIEYAGETTEIEERVPRSSAVAQAYLAQHPDSAQVQNKDASTLRKPLKRPSLFEPNPTGAVKNVPPDKLRPRAPSRLDVLMAEQRAKEAEKKRAEKLTTVQKSALDWKGFVDAQGEGLRQELDEYGKSKRGFLAREEFLGRVDFARDVQAREARLRG